MTLLPHSRMTLPVYLQAPGSPTPTCRRRLLATQPILVERAMYRSVAGQPFAAGHGSAGVTAASTSWFLAEGATGAFFDLFVLLANPNTTPADVEIRYLLNDGTVLTKVYTVAPESRRTIYVDDESFGSAGPGARQTRRSRARSRRPTACRSSSSARCGSPGRR